MKQLQETIYPVMCPKCKQHGKMVHTQRQLIGLDTIIDDWSCYECESSYKINFILMTDTARKNRGIKHPTYRIEQMGDE